jgi:hypothetical protein
MSAYSTLSRVLAGLIAATAWVGLIVQLHASTELAGSVPTSVWIMLRYFTIIANLLVACVFTAAALRNTALASPFLLGLATLAILLVGVVYHLLLRGLVELDGSAKLADFLTHTATPIVVPLFWLFCAPKGGLRLRDPLLWTILPLAYFVYGMIRGALEGIYAYPFMDADRFGWAHVGFVAAAMAAGFVLTGFFMLWLDRALHNRFEPFTTRST